MGFVFEFTNDEINNGLFICFVRDYGPDRCNRSGCGCESLEMQMVAVLSFF